MLQTAPIFQSGMIFQREKPAVIWGKADPDQTVKVSLKGEECVSQADGEGNWKVILPAMPTSQAETLTISGGEGTIVFTDVAIGEVWVAGGQSNMEFQMRYEKHLSEEKPGCENANLRFFDVPEVCYDGQLSDFDYSQMGIWRKATPEDIEHFSAPAYYFQKKISQELHVPVGIIGCNWGGTPSAVWMKPESVERTGKPWMDAYREKVSKLDLNEFWAAQKLNPMNNRGNLWDPFSDFIMPKTPSLEEVGAFFAKLGLPVLDAAYDPNALMPQAIPGTLYEHMVKTIAPFGIRGFLWYQGESDDDLDCQWLYEDMFSALIADWRALWGDDTLPFLFVQLPGFRSWLQVQAKDYPTIRKCQEAVSKKVANTFLCSISDSGEEFDIHPKDKKVVGERLALLALGHVYGKDLLCDAPMLLKTRREANRITLTFANAQGGLQLKGETVEALQVTSEEEEVSYETEISGDSLILTLKEEETSPVKISFARTNWYLVNLYNQGGIPAVPFEIDC